MRDLFVLGNGGHAKVVIDILEEMGDYNIVGIVNKNVGEKIVGIRGYQILGDDTVLQELFNKGIKYCAIGIGHNTDRKRIYVMLKKIGFQVVSAVHPTALISQTVFMGEGNVVFPGVVLNTDVILGNNIIVATGSTIDHDSVIKDHSLISAGVTVGAKTIIEEDSFLGLGCKVVSDVTVCKCVLIGAGAVITKNISEPGTYVGIPGKRIK